MEVDLRSGESEKRTLHWFVNGVTQKIFFKQLPSNVQFGVCHIMCYSSLFNDSVSSSILFVYFFSSPFDSVNCFYFEILKVKRER